MFWFKRALALCLCFYAASACAFTFSYGNLFDVKDVKNEGGILQFPLSRKKYRNVKVLSKDVYKFLGQCSASCQFAGAGAQFTSTDFRQAFTNGNMLIAEVDFNHEISLTFLVFKNKNSFSVKAPEEVVFKDLRLEQQVRTYLIELADKFYEMRG